MNNSLSPPSEPTGLALELVRFIPPLLLEWPEFTTRLEHEVATLFIDVAGFTPLSEALASLGPEGAEILEHTITGYFDALLAVVEQYGGLPIKIAGDSMTVVFACRQERLEHTVRRAVACASILRGISTSDLRIRWQEGTRSLAHKIGVGVGPLLCGPVGDHRRRAEYVFAGSALEQAVASEHRAKAGEVWVSPEAAALIDAPEAWQTKDAQGFCRLGVAALSVVQGLPSSISRPMAQQRDIPEACLSLIPLVVREYAAQGTLNYLSRHQNLTVVFAGAPGMVLDSPDSLQRLDAHYRQMQQIIEQYGGFLSEFEAGDKGAKLIVLFGAPTMLEDPCSQAARCAQTMQQAARELGLVTDQRIGIATGRLYVGTIGCRSLVKFSALGDRMNLAARLMSAAERWSVLADRHTVERAAQAVRWGAGQTLRIKGKEEPVEACALQLARPRGGEERRGRGLIGRMLERQQIGRKLEKLNASQGGLVHIYGPVGIGKTRLIEYIRRAAMEAGVHRISSWSGTSALHSGPLYGLKPLLQTLAGVLDRADEAEQQQLRAWHAGLPLELQPLVALLLDGLGIPWTLDPMFGQLPSERLLLLRQRALIDVLVHGLQGRPHLLLLDHAERLDDPSIQVLVELMPLLRTTPLLVVLAHRSDTLEQVAPFKTLERLSDVENLELKPLTPGEGARLAARRLKALRLDTELAALLQARSQGNPFLVEAWLDVLRDRGQLRVLDNVGYLVGTERMQVLPDRLEALILIQLERLSPEAQLTVRVASVVGQSLTPGEVAAIHPVGLAEASIATHLRLASRADLLWYDRTNAPRMFFSRPEVREAIHDSLPFTLRRTLHALRAEHLQREHGSEPPGDLALILAQHHEYIELPALQQQHFCRAMEVSRERYDHRGTVRWAQRYLEVCDKLQDDEGLLLVADTLQNALGALGVNVERLEVIRRWIDTCERRAEIPRLLQALQVSARVHQQIGDMTTAQAHLEQALSVARAQPDRESLADVLTICAIVYGEAGQLQRAYEAAEEAIQHVSGIGNTERLYRIYFGRAFALFHMGRVEEAHKDNLEALRLCEVTRDLWKKAVLLGNLGIELWSIGHPEEGHAHLIRVLELKRQLGNRREIGMGYLNAGYSFYRLGELQRARIYTEEALRFFAQLGYFRGVLVATSNLGEIHWLLGAGREAHEHYDRAEELLRQHGHEPLQFELWIRQGELALSEGEYLRARGYFEQVLDRSSVERLPDVHCNALEGLAEACLNLNRLDEAQIRIAAALKQLTSSGSLHMFPQRVWWRASRIAAAAGDLEAERADHLEALELIEKEQKLLCTRAARARLGKAFPWNLEILLHASPSAFIPPKSKQRRPAPASME